MKKIFSIFLLVLTIISTSSFLFVACDKTTDKNNSNKTCEHNFTEWSKDTPCGYYEFRHCLICNKSENREASAVHTTNENGLCSICGEKVYYTKEEVKNIIQVQYLDVGEYNQAALSEIKIIWKNTSDKTVIETVFTVKAWYQNDVDSKSCFSYKTILPGETCEKEWETLWPSGMSHEKITSIRITYEDGTKLWLDDKSIEYIYSKN